MSEGDSSKRFGFEIPFSRDVAGLRLTVVLAALLVTGGRAAVVKRLVGGQNRRVTVRVRRAGLDDMRIPLAATGDCAAAGAICTRDERKLRDTATAQVQGPAVLSVADAYGSERANVAIEFVVTLNRDALGTVSLPSIRSGSSAFSRDFLPWTTDALTELSVRCCTLTMTPR